METDSSPGFKIPDGVALSDGPRVGRYNKALDVKHLESQTRGLSLSRACSCSRTTHSDGTSMNVGTMTIVMQKGKATRTHAPAPE